LSRPATKPSPSAPRGFTLAEILIAVAIFALLVSIVMGSFSGVFYRTEDLARQRINNAMARSCLMRMATDLAGLYVERRPFFKPPGNTEEPTLYRFVVDDSPGDGSDPAVRLRFASRAHVDLSGRGSEGIAVIRYYLEARPAGSEPLFRLRRADVLSGTGELPPLSGDPILCDNIRALKIEVLDGEGENSAAWDSDDADVGFATPRAVMIRLELDAPTNPTVYQTVVALPLWRPAQDQG
jgi:general secretion pathway protein J